MYLSLCEAGLVDTGLRPCSPVLETSWSESGALLLVSACSVVWRRARRTTTQQVHLHTQTCTFKGLCQQKILNPQNCLDKSRSTNCDQEPLECKFFFCFSNNYMCRLYIFILLVIVFMLLFSALFKPVVFDILNVKYRRLINKSSFCVCVLNQAVIRFMATRCRP